MAVDLKQISQTGQVTKELVVALKNDAKVHSDGGSFISPEGRVYKAVWENNEITALQRDKNRNDLWLYIADFCSFLSKIFLGIEYMSTTYTAQLKSLSRESEQPRNELSPKIESICELGVEPERIQTGDDVGVELGKLENAATDQVTGICRMSVGESRMVKEFENRTKTAIKEKIGALRAQFSEENVLKLPAVQDAFRKTKKEVEDILDRFYCDMVSVKTSKQLEVVLKMEATLTTMNFNLTRDLPNYRSLKWTCEGMNKLADKAYDKFAVAVNVVKTDIEKSKLELAELKESISNFPCADSKLAQLNQSLLDKQAKIAAIETSYSNERALLSKRDVQLVKIVKDIAGFFGDMNLMGARGLDGESTYYGPEIQNQICYLDWLEKELMSADFIFNKADLTAIDQKVRECMSNITSSVPARTRGRFFDVWNSVIESLAPKSKYTPPETHPIEQVTFESLVLSVSKGSADAGENLADLKQKNPALLEKIGGLNRKIIGHQFIVGTMALGEIARVFEQELNEIKNEVSAFKKEVDDNKLMLATELLRSEAMNLQTLLTTFLNSYDIKQKESPRLAMLEKWRDACSTPEQYADLAASVGGDVRVAVGMHIQSIELGVEIDGYLVDLDRRVGENQSSQGTRFDSSTQARINSLREIVGALYGETVLIDELTLESISHKYSDYQQEINTFISKLGDQEANYFEKEDRTYEEFRVEEFKQKAALIRKILDETKKDLLEIIVFIATTRKEELGHLDSSSAKLLDSSEKLGLAANRLKKNERLLDQLGFDVDRLPNFLNNIYSQVLGGSVEEVGESTEKANPKLKLRELLAILNTASSKTVLAT